MDRKHTTHIIIGPDAPLNSIFPEEASKIITIKRDAMAAAGSPTTAAKCSRNILCQKPFVIPKYVNQPKKMTANMLIKIATIHVNRSFFFLP